MRRLEVKINFLWILQQATESSLVAESQRQSFELPADLILA